MIFQTALIVFALFGIFHVFRQYKNQKVSVYWLVVWGIFWIVVILVAFMPQMTDVVANYVGVEKGADLISYSAIVILSYSMYRVLIRLEKLRKEITDLVRRIAIRDADKNIDVVKEDGFDI